MLWVLDIMGCSRCFHGRQGLNYLILPNKMLASMSKWWVLCGDRVGHTACYVVVKVSNKIKKVPSLFDKQLYRFFVGRGGSPCNQAICPLCLYNTTNFMVLRPPQDLWIYLLINKDILHLL